MAAQLRRRTKVPMARRAKRQRKTMSLALAKGRSSGTAGRVNRLGRPATATNAKLYSLSTETPLNEATLNLSSGYAGAITQDSDGGNVRQRDVINLRAIKYSAIFRNRLAQPVIVNVAHVVPRIDTFSSAGNEFFRKGATSTQRGVDFSNTLSAIDLGTLPLNSDNFDVLKRHTFTLGVNGDFNASAGTDRYQNGRMPSFKTIKDFIPINRQIRYGTTTANNTPLDDVFTVVWCVGMEYTGSTPATNAVTFQSRRDT